MGCNTNCQCQTNHQKKENKKSSPEDKLSLLSEMKALLVEAEDVLQDKHKDLNDFGRLLHKTWELKRKTAKTISTDSIDALYEQGRKAGALGGKLLGAGGGGFLLFYVEKEKQGKVLEKIGADMVVYPEREMGETLAKKIMNPKLTDYFKFSEEDFGFVTNFPFSPNPSTRPSAWKLFSYRIGFSLSVSLNGFNNFV